MVYVISAGGLILWTFVGLVIPPVLVNPILIKRIIMILLEIILDDDG